MITGLNTKKNTNAFGMPMPGRSYQSSNSYRYGFNGKEKDDETGTQDYGMRIYNTVLGRFLSVDPITKEYPCYTPYQFAGNTPIQAIDLDGREPDYIVSKGKLTTPVLFLFNSVLNYKISMMTQVNITKLSDPNPDVYAETWSAKDVRTQDKSQTGGNNWLRTLGHEFKHVEQFSKSGLSDPIDRTLFSVETFISGYNSLKNTVEQPGRDAGKVMQDFAKKYNVDGILSNNSLSDERKIAQLGVIIENNFIEQDKAEIKTYQNHLNTPCTDEVKKQYKGKIDNLNTEIKGHQKNIDNYKKIDAILATEKKEG